MDHGRMDAFPEKEVWRLTRLLFLSNLKTLFNINNSHTNQLLSYSSSSSFFYFRDYCLLLVSLQHTLLFMVRLCDAVHGSRPALVMVATQIVLAIANIFFKMAANDGMVLKILVAYRLIFAAVLLLPFALVQERRAGQRTKITWLVVLQGFLCGLFGAALAQNLYLECLALTSATFASAISNLLPAITFIIGIICRMERLDVKSLTGLAKLGGTCVGVGGAMLLTFYKGPRISIWSTHVDLLRHSRHHNSHLGHRSHTISALLGISACLSYAIWLIIQAKMSDKNPNYYSTTALMNVMGALQSTLYALFTVKDWGEWRLGWNIRLLTVSYSGIMASGTMVALMAWCVHMRGPLFVSVFNPLMLVIVALLGSFLLNEKLHMGTIIGAMLIIMGLYYVLWGKKKESKRVTRLVPSTKPQPEDASLVVPKPTEPTVFYQK